MIPKDTYLLPQALLRLHKTNKLTYRLDGENGENVMFYVVDDARARAREAFVTDALGLARARSSYSYYFVVEFFDNREEADGFCESYNYYDDEPDVELTCCSKGCTMTAFDYAHRGDGCAYEGT